MKQELIIILLICCILYLIYNIMLIKETNLKLSQCAVNCSKYFTGKCPEGYTSVCQSNWYNNKINYLINITNNGGFYE